MTLSAQPLIDLAGACGLSREQLRQAETTERLRGTFRVPGTSIRTLKPKTVRAALKEYKHAIGLKFTVGQVVEQEIDQGTADQNIGTFLAGAQPGDYDLVLDLDKTLLVEGLLQGSASRARVVLYLFAETLRSQLTRGLGAFEDDVWQDPDRLLGLLIPDNEIRLVGEHLIILGGTHIDEGSTLLARPVPDMSGARAMAELRDRYIGWDHPWVKKLTPAHFLVQGDSIDVALHELVDAQFLKLAILFTCDRARQRELPEGGSEIRAEFRGREHLAIVVIGSKAPLTAPPAGSLASVASVVNWCYERQSQEVAEAWTADRLPFLQTRVAQALEGRPEAQRFQDFATLMPLLAQGLAWQWKAFIEGKINEYLDRTKQLEGVVSEAVEQFGQRTSALVKSLSDTILAAVAVLIGSFLAAALHQPFDATVFRIGVVAYGVYVFLFPGTLGLVVNANRMHALEKDFSARRASFAALLMPDRVATVIGNRIDDAIHLYWLWFGWVTAFYVVVVGASVVAAVLVPHHVQ